MAARPGTIIAGRFRLERLAGSGAMGSVYRARDLVRDQDVAIKLFDRRSGQRARFRREIDILRSLRHPGIAAYIDDGITADQQPYLIMEWVEGRTLHERLARGRLGQADALELGLRVAGILEALHGHGLVHRDLTPANLLLTHETTSVDQVVLVDFGLVSVRSRARTNSPLTREGAVLGTPCFMAPEQARGASNVDARADLYSLGAVLFMCLTGKPPFSGVSVMAVLSKLVLEPPPRVRELCSEVSPAVDGLIARLLAKDPARRPASAAELAGELERARGLIGSLPAPVARPGTSRPGSRALAQPSPDTEQRFVSLLLMGYLAAQRSASVRASLDAQAAHHGGELVRLADGTVLAVFAADSAPAATAVRAARCALAVHRLYPGAPIALATGRWGVDAPGFRIRNPAGQVPMGAVIDRAVALLSEQESPLLALERLSGEIRLGGGAIVVDDVTAGMLAGRFHLHRPQAPGAAAGQPAMLLDEIPVSRAARRLAGEDTPCVGHEHELDRLLEVFAASAGAPAARAVLITAPAGAGKSRLACELARRLGGRATPVPVWASRGDVMAAGAPLGMLSQLVLSGLGVASGLAGAAARKLIAQRAEHRLGAGGRVIAPFLGELAGISFTASEHPGLADARQDAQLMHDRMLQAWLDWLDAETARGPVVCMLDDLQWSDSATLRFCDAALRNLAGRPLLLVALARSEPGDSAAQRWSELWAQHPVERISLAPLPLDERQEVALSAEERQFARTASVFGGCFWSEGVAALASCRHQPAEDAAGQVTPVLDRLVERELIVARRHARFAGCAEYSFRHQRIRAAAYASLADHEARSAHAAAGRWLEQIGESQPLVLAEHYWRGDDRERALPWYQRAAEQALAANDAAQVLAWVERACTCGAAGITLGALRLLQAEAESCSGQYRPAHVHGRQAMALLPRDSSLWARAAEHTAWAACHTGDPGRAAEIAGIAALLVTLMRGDAHRMALVRCAAGLARCGQLEQAGDLLARVDADLGRAGSRVEAAAMSTHAALAVLSGRLDQAAARYQQAVAGWHAVQDWRNACKDEIHLGRVLGELGEHERAIEVWRASTQHAERLASPQLLGHARRRWAVALARGQRHSEAKELLLCSARADAGDHTQAFVYLHGAEIALLEGEPTLALVRADSAIALRRDTNPGIYAQALAWRARALLRLGRERPALTATREATRILAEQGGALEEGDACLRLAHAQALHATGCYDDAAAAIVAAKERLLARAALIHEPQRRASFLERVADHRHTLELARQWSPSDQAAS